MTQKNIEIGIKVDGVAESTLQGIFIGAFSSTPTVPDTSKTEAEGMIILNTTDGKYYQYKDSAWSEYALAVDTELANKVDKVDGKGLSTNDFTDAQKEKLDGIETGAQVNKVTDVQAGSISVLEGTIAKLGTASAKNVGTAGGEVPVLGSNGKLANSVIPTLAIAEFKGSVSTKADLVSLSKAEQGDIAQVTDDSNVNNDGIWFLNGTYSTLTDWIQIVGPGAVISVNTKSGVVTLTASDVDAVPVKRTVNGKALSADISLDAEDVGALTETTADSKYATIDTVGKKQDDILSKAGLSVATDDWTAVSDMGDFKYRAPLTLTGCTESMIPQVVFAINQATSSDYAPICQSGTNCVYIWSTKNDAISGITVMAIPQ